jgi:hypothetical protein
MGHETPPHLLFSTIRQKFSVTELTTDREDGPAEKSIEIAQTSENLIENVRRGHTAKSLLLQTYRVIAMDNRLRADL